MNYIMILEDDEELAFGMEMALKDKDFSFTVCSTVKDAAAALKSQTFDLLLLDVNLPDGQRLRLLPGHPQRKQGSHYPPDCP